MGRSPRLAAGALAGLVLALGCARQPLVDVTDDGVLTVACLGDSNTTALRDDGVIPWCDLLPALLPSLRVRRGGRTETVQVTYLNFGHAGATACPDASTSSDSLRELAGVDRPLDVVLAAFGSNDVVILHRTPEQVRACYRVLAQRTAPARLLIALAPPVFLPGRDYDPDIVRLNGALRVGFWSSELLDFHGGFVRTDYIGAGLHLGNPGQTKRARIAVAALHRLEAR